MSAFRYLLLIFTATALLISTSTILNAETEIFPRHIFYSVSIPVRFLLAVLTFQDIHPLWYMSGRYMKFHHSLRRSAYNTAEIHLTPYFYRRYRGRTAGRYIRLISTITTATGTFIHCFYSPPNHEKPNQTGNQQTNSAAYRIIMFAEKSVFTCIQLGVIPMQAQCNP